MKASILTFIVVLLTAQFSASSSAQESDDRCASEIVPMIQQAGLDVQISAPAFGCRQADNGSWHMPTIADVGDEAVSQQLDSLGAQILAAVDRMSSDVAFGNTLLFERENALILVPGIGGVYDRIDASNFSLRGPGWLNNLQERYNQAVMVYFTRTAGNEIELVQYMQWLMARRDVTLNAMATFQNPLAATAFVAYWGYHQAPWPWQLADQAAIAAYTGQSPLDFTAGLSTALRPTSSTIPTAASVPTVTSGTSDSQGVVFTPSRISAIPGETVRVIIQPEVRTDSGSFALDVNIPDGLQLLSYPSCFGLYPNACAVQPLTFNPDQSLEISATGILSSERPFELGMDIRVADHVPVGSVLLITANIDYVIDNTSVPTETSTIQFVVK